MECGQPSHYSLTIEGGHERHYYLRPPKACSIKDVFPLLLLVHCYGCTAKHELDKYSEAADKYGFALAVPKGIASSWNAAPDCCGPAMQSGLDDVGFIDMVVADASKRLRLAPRALFASGFSNGGFLTSKLPHSSKVHWAGISPAAGHEYKVRAPAPTPIYIHHCEADEKVRFEGCCAGGQCCCGIGRHQQTCVSTRALHGDWLKLNRCQGSRTEAGPNGATCTVGLACAANTTLCVYGDGCSHSDWVEGFAAADSVLDFFAREACSAHTGHWHTVHSRCACPSDRRGRWCLDLLGGTGRSGGDGAVEVQRTGGPNRRSIEL